MCASSPKVSLERGRICGPFFNATLHPFFTQISHDAGEGTRHQVMGVGFQTEAIKNGRLAERRHLLVSVKIRRPGETWFRSRVADLSITGFRLQSFMKLAADDCFWIMLPGFEGRRAQVLWTRGHEAGCQFERPLHPAILDHIIRVGR